MRQRVAALSGLGVAALLGFALLWTGIGTKPVSAMEKMAESIRLAKSYKCSAISKIVFESRHIDPAKTTEGTTERKETGYWLAPNSVRTETTDSSTWQGPGPEKTRIMPGLNKPCIAIDNLSKKFSRLPPRAKEFSPLESLENFGKFSASADRDLGTKEIDGRRARGFVIDTKKIDPDFPPQMMEIWIDSETNLPVFLRCDTKTELMSTTVEVSSIQWNIDLDPKLFDPTPPEGYTDATPKPPSAEEQIRPIIEALRTYAQAGGGHYPPERRVDVNAGLDLIKMLGVGGKAQLKEPPEVGIRGVCAKAIEEFNRIPEENRGEALRAMKGFQKIGDIQAYNPDFAYYGKTVGPNDKDKVLLRWKLDDGRYEVIFGDLRAETVTAEQLHALEGK